MSTGRSLVALFVAVLTIGWAVPAGAQSAKPPKKTRAPAAAAPARAPAAKAAAEPKKAAGRKVVRLEEMRVEGRIQKPQALLLMPRASVASGDADRDESFLPKIKDATQKDPF